MFVLSSLLRGSLSVRQLLNPIGPMMLNLECCTFFLMSFFWCLLNSRASDEIFQTPLHPFFSYWLSKAHHTPSMGCVCGVCLPWFLRDLSVFRLVVVIRTFILTCTGEILWLVFWRPHKMHQLRNHLPLKWEPSCVQFTARLSELTRPQCLWPVCV